MTFTLSCTVKVQCTCHLVLIMIISPAGRYLERNYYHYQTKSRWRPLVPFIKVRLHKIQSLYLMLISWKVIRRHGHDPSLSLGSCRIFFFNLNELRLFKRHLPTQTTPLSFQGRWKPEKTTILASTSVVAVRNKAQHHLRICLYDSI